MRPTIDRKDWRLIGKLRACEDRPSGAFSPGLRLIGHDLTMPVVTVWRRLWRLSRFGLVVIWKAPRRGMRYLWRTRARYRPQTPNRYTPPLRGEYSTPRTAGMYRNSVRKGAEHARDPPESEAIAQTLLSTSLRSGLPVDVREPAVRKLARELAADGLDPAGAVYLVKRSHGRPELLGWFVGKPHRWRAVLLDLGLARNSVAPQPRARVTTRQVSPGLTVNVKPKGAESLGALLGALVNGYPREHGKL